MAILLVALFTSGTLPSDPLVGIAIAIVGILLSLTWHAVQNRALGHLMRHEMLITKLETSLDFAPDFAVSADLNRGPYDTYLNVSKEGPESADSDACVQHGRSNPMALSSRCLLGQDIRLATRQIVCAAQRLVPVVTHHAAPTKALVVLQAAGGGCAQGPRA